MNKILEDDYVCIGFGTAGDIKHWTTGTKKGCQNCARQIRSHYKSVKVVEWNKAQELLKRDDEMRYQYIF